MPATKRACSRVAKSCEAWPRNLPSCLRAPRPFVTAVPSRPPLSLPRAGRLRRALEALGPIFAKFGKMLSTRRALLPPDIADELAKLQARVPPFPSAQVIATLARIYGK